MTDELPDVPALRVLEPPPDGLLALRARLDARRRRWWWWLAIPAVAAAVAILLLRARTAPPPVSAPEGALPDREIGATFYWVASAPRGTVRAQPPLPVVTTIAIGDAPQVETRTVP